MNTLKRDLKIALLLGGPGAEREVSLVSGNSVYDALCRAGFTDVTKVDVHGPDFRLPEGTELAYNIIHGTFGEDGTLQAILEERGVPYTGAGSRSSALCFDKSESKKVFLDAGVPTPQAEILDCSNGIVMPSLPLPFVIKPPCEGSSVGVHIVRRQEDVLPAMKEAVTHGTTVLVEEFSLAGTGKAECRLYTTGTPHCRAATRPDRAPWVWTRSGRSRRSSSFSALTSSLW